MDQRFVWNMKVNLDIPLQDLTQECRLRFQIFDMMSVDSLSPVGEAWTPIFTEFGELKNGTINLRVKNLHPGAPTEDSPELTKILEELDGYESDYFNYQQGYIHKVEWLDQFSVPELIKKMEKLRDMSQQQFLNINLLDFSPNGKNVGKDKVYVFIRTPLLNNHKKGLDNLNKKMRENKKRPKTFDPEIDDHNPYDHKHNMLTRNIRPEDEGFKPNGEIKEQLNSIIKYPLTRSLTEEESVLIWKHRYYLKDYMFALTKFLKSFDCNYRSNKDEMRKLLSMWTQIDEGSALELLGPNFKDTEASFFFGC